VKFTEALKRFPQAFYGSDRQFFDSQGYFDFGIGDPVGFGKFFQPLAVQRKAQEVAAPGNGPDETFGHAPYPRFPVKGGSDQADDLIGRDRLIVSQVIDPGWYVTFK